MSLTQKKPSSYSSENKYNLLHFCGISVLNDISGKAKLSMASSAFILPSHFLTPVVPRWMIVIFMPQNISPALSAILLLSITFSFYWKRQLNCNCNRHKRILRKQRKWWTATNFAKNSAPRTKILSLPFCHSKIFNPFLLSRSFSQKVKGVYIPEDTVNIQIMLFTAFRSEK